MLSTMKSPARVLKETQERLWRRNELYGESLELTPFTPGATLAKQYGYGCLKHDIPCQTASAIFNTTLRNHAARRPHTVFLRELEALQPRDVPGMAHYCWRHEIDAPADAPAVDFTSLVIPHTFEREGDEIAANSNCY